MSLDGQTQFIVGLVVFAVLLYLFFGKSSKPKRASSTSTLQEGFLQSQGQQATLQQIDNLRRMPQSANGGVGDSREFVPWSNADPLLGGGSGTFGRMRVLGPMEY